MMQIRSRIAAAAILLACLGAIVPASAGTLLPPGMTTFFDLNGQPLSAGCVYFYVPGTSTSKDTFLDAAQTQLNTNPVQLDASGRAIIYGTGVYRQVVKTSPCGSLGVQIWDQITADTSSSTTIYAGASAGTPNSITVNAPAFSGTDGQVINYVSTNTNTGGATINPSGFGSVQIVRDSATGPGGLTGGELVATNAVSLIYDATAGTFHILSPVTWPNTSGVPVGATIAISGFTAPTNYAFAYGQAVSRTSFSSLLAAYTSAQSGSISTGSPIITGLSDTTQFGAGQIVEAVGIPANDQVLGCTSSTCTLSANATATRTGTMTFFAYGDGDGSTTFNIPDYRGKGLNGRDNMGGTAANVMQVAANLSTTSGSATATASSATNLALGMSIVGNINVAFGATISAISGTTITMSANAISTQASVATRFSPLIDAQRLGVSGGAMIGSLAIPNLPAATLSVTDTRTWQTLASNGANNGTGQVSTNTSASGASYAAVSFNSGSGINIPVQVATGGISAALGGSGTPVSEIPPVSTVNWAVRLTP